MNISKSMLGVRSKFTEKKDRKSIETEIPATLMKIFNQVGSGLLVIKSMVSFLSLHLVSKPGVHVLCFYLHSLHLFLESTLNSGLKIEIKIK